MSSSVRRAFTLIELLIVVAIIAILAAIAVPNFLEAQTRSKVARVISDQRTLATALESYHIDQRRYPQEFLPGQPWRQGSPYTPIATRTLVVLTTPVAYITSTNALVDPFVKDTTVLSSIAGGSTPVGQINSMFYLGYEWTGPLRGLGTAFSAWGLVSLGPDAQDSEGAFPPIFANLPTGAGWMATQAPNTQYDPTNGTISQGDITRYGGDIPGGMTSFLGN